MSKFLKHEPCPECQDLGKDRAGDNLGVWDDGSKWCFSCGYHETEVKNTAYVKRKLTQEVKNNDNHSVNMPSDCNTKFPIDVTDWLNQYKLTDREIQEHMFLWSHARQMLVMPTFRANKSVLYWQGRHFSPKVKAKYQTYGNPSLYTEIIGDKDTNAVILVEDKISAIKVGRVGQAMPLYGSSVNLQQVIDLSKNFNNCVLWLDKDKSKEMLDIKDWINVYFERVFIILSEQDPKCYNETQMNDMLVKAHPIPQNSTTMWHGVQQEIDRRREKMEDLLQEPDEDRPLYSKYNGGS